jgi:signal transduction histidine kinase
MPIIFLTNGTNIDLETYALSSGGDEFIRKTDTDDYLLKKLTSRLRRLDQIRSLNGQLLHAQQRSERLRKSQNDFLTYVTHELKSPLHVMLGFGNLLKMDNRLNPEQIEMVDEIVRSGQTQLALIEDLSEQVKIATGSLSLKLETFEIAPLLKQVIADASVLGLQSGITVQAEPEAGQSVQIRADRRRLIQILNNLLSNAIKYNKPHGKVRVGLQQRSNGMLRISVIDTGIGIAREDLEYVFEAFERLSAQHRSIEGIGIGLSICSQLIGLMGGNIGVDSELHIGSQFWIELPLSLA